MLGMAIGNFRAGRRTGGSANSAAMFLLAGLGVFAIASPALIWILEALNRAIFAGEWAWSGVHLVRGILIALFLAIPTILMGAMFPMLVRLEVVGDQAGGAGRGLGRVYGVGTLGGAVGAWISGFYLLGTLGVMTTILIAGALCILAMLLLRKSPAQNSAAETKPSEVGNAGNIKWIVIGAMFISGFTGLGYEIVWTRIMTYFFRDSIYDLSIVLTVFLLGLMIGAAAGVELLRFIKKPWGFFAAVHITLGLTSLLGLFIVHEFPYTLGDLQTFDRLADEYPNSYWTMGVLMRVGAAAAVMLVPAGLLGMTYPLAMAICSRENGGSVGRNAGFISGANSIGAACGAIATAFFLIGAFQLNGACITLAVINVAAGCLLLLLNFESLLRYRIVTAASGAVIMGIVFTALPTWDPLRMSTSFLVPDQKLEEFLKLPFQREDEFGVTVVAQLSTGEKRLVTNRLYSQNTSYMLGLEDHRRLGHIPMFLHPSPKKTLVVGLGVGITLRGVAEHDVESIDCVEISGAVIAASKYFKIENGNVADDPRVKMIVDDGRAYVAATAKKYDVIIGDIYFPMSAGSGAMFTTDYYAQCKSRLADGGVMCQWLPANQLAEEDLKTIFRSFQQVFPHATVWFGLIGEKIPVVGMIACDGPLSVDDAAIGKRLADPRFKLLSEINLNTPHLLLSGLALTQVEMRGYAGGGGRGAVNTDDRPITEFSAPKSVTHPGRQGVENMLKIADAGGTGPSAILPAKVASADFSEFAAAKRFIIKMFALPPAKLQERYNILKAARLLYPENEELEKEYELALSMLALEQTQTLPARPPRELKIGPK
jgi:spermidine synthase